MPVRDDAICSDPACPGRSAVHCPFHGNELGKPCDEIRPGYRKFPQGSHLIFYRNGSDGVIEIIRILHGSMDHETAFPER
jgi:plasmid stabilization system protein ParE